MKYTINELDVLFEASPPSILKDRLQFLYFQYLITTKAENLHPEFNQMSEDFYFLFRFLDEVLKESAVTTL
jgi:hypothetical protein